MGEKLNPTDMNTKFLKPTVQPREKGVYYYQELNINAKINYKGLYGGRSGLMAFLKADGAVWVASTLA